MVDEADHQQLRERLVVWKGPLDFDLGKEKTERCFLADLAESLRVTDIVIDSLKDVAVDLIKDDVGGRVSFQIGETIARGIEVCVLHHQRKAQQGGPKPKALAGVYGSHWLTAGMGSVLMLCGEPGDLVVELRHLKHAAS
jgi:replicative DNA helicase